MNGLIGQRPSQHVGTLHLKLVMPTKRRNIFSAVHAKVPVGDWAFTIVPKSGPATGNPARFIGLRAGSKTLFRIEFNGM